MNKILLIDGHSILNRAFYGVPDLTNKDGLHTNAIFGFLNIMLKAMDDEKPTHLAVAFDLHAPTFRHEMYKEYKGTRHPMPDELREQVPVMKELLQQEEMRILEATLLKYNGDKNKAMEELEMSRADFYRKLSKYGIDSASRK